MGDERKVGGDLPPTHERAVVGRIDGGVVTVVGNSGVTFHLSGVAKPHNVRVGDKGTVRYEMSRAWGMWLFEPDVRRCQNCGAMSDTVICDACLQALDQQAEDRIAGGGE